MEVPPEIEAVANRIKWKYGQSVRNVDARFYTKALEEAEEYQGCFVAFWNWRGMKTFVMYRKDRAPQKEEFLPFLQCLFDDGQIQELVTTPFSKHFVQGEPLFETGTMADKMGVAIAEYADRKDDVEQFDFDKTGTANRMIKKLRRNGTN